MGYIEKRELIEKLKADRSFTTEEVNLLDSLIEKDRLMDNEAVLKEWTISKLEESGLRNKFLTFCETNGLFPQWVENVKKGID
ncbi:hypothetical protein L6470_12740 [Prevotella communis]|uniref:hypothetical protein n=1 Tax=Prevotella communis TaxID=2913614 RepID=UPI001EDB1996|nr:hypothetical protein [Prevotella communis]UKK59212.1 hypothetical protein L6470_12740 [Prevotella communis]